MRQDLILKGSSKRKTAIEQDDSDDSDYGEIEEQALKMLPNEFKQMVLELEAAGTSKAYIKRKIRQAVQQKSDFMMFPPDGSAQKSFKANYEISFNDLQFDRKISEGGYGIVYRGRWKHTTVAIKEIKREIIE